VLLLPAAVGLMLACRQHKGARDRQQVKPDMLLQCKLSQPLHLHHHALDSSSRHLQMI
jgi:hypothetical protein